MTDESTPEAASSGPGDADAGTSPDPGETKGFNKDWIPAIGLGVVLLSVLVFAGGFLTGRATADEAQWDADDRVVVHVERGDLLPRGFDFEEFDRRGPQGRFLDPRSPRFENFEIIPEAALDRLCGFLEDEAIPPNAPFVDRLAELCAAEGL